jgi:hypothetical protein
MHSQSNRRTRVLVAGYSRKAYPRQRYGGKAIEPQEMISTGKTFGACRSSYATDLCTRSCRQGYGAESLCIEWHSAHEHEVHHPPELLSPESPRA